MTIVKVTSVPTGTGIIDIQAPVTNNNRTITLPDQTDTLMGTTTPVTQAQLETALNASGSAPMFACRAWVLFDGRTTVTVKGSGNVSSVVRNGTGDYTINFSTALPDANYVVGGAALTHTAGSVQALWTIHGSGSAGATTPTLKSTTQLRILTGLQNSTGIADLNEVCVMVFR